MKKDAFYFSHDANAQSDPKILRLLSKHSWYGYGLFWAIVEMLRNESGYKLETDYETYAFALRTDEDSIKSVVEDFGLFVVEGGVFYSESLLQRMEIKEAKSQKARESALARWKNKDSDSKAMRTHSDSNAIKEKKGKEKKQPLSGYSEKFETFWKAYPNKQGKFKAFTSWKKYNCDNGIFDSIMDSLEAHKQSKGWTKDNGDFIPHGSTWVHGKGWEDEIETIDEWG